MIAEGAAAGAAAAAIAQAIRASGVIVQVSADDFLSIVHHQQKALVVHAVAGFFTTSYRYLTSYKGLAFFTASPQELILPSDVEFVIAKKIWIPG
jgi:hypothetical protein